MQSHRGSFRSIAFLPNTVRRSRFSVPKIITLAIAVCCSILPTFADGTDENIGTSPPPKIAAFIDKCQQAVPESIKAVETQLKFVRSPRFRATPKERRDLSDKLKQMLEELKKGDTLPVLRIPLDKAGVGDIGFFTNGNPNEPATVAVFQVLDENSLLCKHRGRVFWLETPTEKLIDDSLLYLNDVLEVAGTQRYDTAAGGTNTVFRLERFDIELAKAWFEKIRTQ
jgi:hypothetical protein